jgi:hypothetical protein
MADKRHRTQFDITATDNATRVFKSVETSLTSLHGKYLAFGAAAAGVFGAGGAASFIVDATRYRAALQDISDTTGDNVRTVDGMARAWRVAGGEIEQLSTTMAKFAKNLNSADDEGQAAAQAITALGLSVTTLRAMKPADAMLEVAKALGGFQDGASKVAVAVALMGKEGAKNLPVLKDIAEAGGVVGKVTEEQAAEAKKLEQEWRKLKLAFDDGKDALVSSLIPALANVVEQMRQGIAIAGGFGNAIRLFGTLSPGQDIGQAITDKQAELDAWKSAGPMGRFFKKPLGSSYAGTEGDIQRQLDFLKFLRVQQYRETAPGGAMDMGVGLGDVFKPKLDFVPSKAGAENDGRLSPVKIAQMQFAAEQDFREQTQKWRAEQIEATKKYNDELQKSADHYRDLIDPLRKFGREWETLDELLRQGVISQEEYLDAYVKVAEAADKARLEIEGVSEEAKRSKNAFHEMGFTATSALEEIIFKGGQASDIIRALGQDLAKIFLRKTVFDPLAAGAGKAHRRVLRAS